MLYALVEETILVDGLAIVVDGLVGCVVEGVIDHRAEPTV
jgi:hypothetical protein